MDENGNKQINQAPPQGSDNRPNGKSNLAFKVFLCVLGGILLFGFIFGLATDNLGGVFGVICSVAAAILVLLLMITVHELGHYAAGKIFGFGITEFSLGFGPALYSKVKKNGEIFSVRALPFGGYCAFEGEDEDNVSPTAFNNRKPWQRIIVLVAGATMNFLLALVFIIMLFGIYGQSRMVAFEIVPDTEYSLSLSGGDALVSLNGKSIYLQTDLIDALNGKKKGDTVSAEVARDGRTEKINITLREDVASKNSTDIGSVSRALGIAELIYIDKVNEGSPFKEGDALFRECTSVYENDVSDPNGKYRSEKRFFTAADVCEYLNGYSAGDEVMMWIHRDDEYFRLKFTLGETDFTEENVFSKLGIAEAEYYDRWSVSNVRLGIGETLGGTFAYAFRIAGTILRVLGELLTGKLLLNSVGGTVTTVVMTSKAIRVGGLSFLLDIAAYIGVNLAVFNLLPIPALDGSRVVFTLIEMIFRKPVPKKLEAVIHTIGLVALLAFAVTVDLLQLF